jgi:hypothetical protein
VAGGDTAAADGIARLQRWQQFGAVWRVVSRSGDDVTISLCRCDDGEEVERFTSADPRLLRWLGPRLSSDA